MGEKDGLSQILNGSMKLQDPITHLQSRLCHNHCKYSCVHDGVFFSSPPVAPACSSCWIATAHFKRSLAPPLDHLSTKSSSTF